MANRLWNRWLVVVAAALICTYAAVILRAYRTPPLSFSITTTQRAENAYLIGIDLHNLARWPVTLRDARVNFAPQAQIASIVSLVDPTAPSACLASTAVLYPNACNPSQAGNVAGWLVPPARPGGNMHGLRVELPFDVEPGERTLVLSYWYLGWPFTVQQQLR